MDQLSLNEALIALAVAAAAGVVGFLLGHVRLRGLRREINHLKSEVTRSESQGREQARLVAKMRGEQRTVASVVRLLPSIVRELNSSDLDPGRLPSLVLHLAEAIFEPEQVLLYLVRSPGGERAERELFLRTARGLGSTPDRLKRVAFGEGKIGWVAEQKVEMATEDWLNLSRTDGRALDDNHPGCRLDLIGPLLHHSVRGEQVLGVLCIGAPSVRLRDEKLMLQMITNLGSIALMNTYNVGKLRELADHDGLTELLNKRRFMLELGLLINTAEREAQTLSVFIFDIDYFKRYNDSHGHLAGDELLKAMAKMLRENLRPGDTPCRYGGEEFVVAMPETGADAAFQVADRLRHAIERFAFSHANTQPNGRLTISGGVATFPVDGTNGTELLSHADQALYQAKAAGRNRTVQYRGVDIGDASGDFSDDPYFPAAGTAKD